MALYDVAEPCVVMQSYRSSQWIRDDRRRHRVDPACYIQKLTWTKRELQSRPIIIASNHWPKSVAR